MEQKYLILIFITWLLQEIFYVSKLLYWIQDKEYRRDRILDFLLSPESIQELNLIEQFLKLILLLIYPDVIIFLLIFIFVKYIWSVILKQFRRPVITSRILKITAIIFISMIGSLWGILYFGNLKFLIIAELFIYLSLFVGIYLTSLISKNIFKKERNAAEKKLNEVKPYVIGVTGSYGKTTTKDFIFQLVSENYSSLRNEGSKNTAFGIVRTVNKSLSDQSKYFICEVGAYKRKEIQDICSWLKPDMGVITAIEEQHLKLFGNIDNIIKAKFELLESLKRGSYAVLNFNNKYLRFLAKDCDRLGLKVYGIKKYANEAPTGLRPGYILPSLRREQNPSEAENYSHSSSRVRLGRFSAKGDNKNMQKNILYYRNIPAENNHRIMEVYYNNRKRIFRTNIDQGFFAENLALAILVGRLMKVDWKTIKTKLEKMTLPDKTMNLIELKNGSIIIDDSYNSTSTGTLSALKYLQEFDNFKKIVFLTGIIELGSSSDNIHKNIGKELNNVADKVILRKKCFVKPISQGMGNGKHKLSLITDSHKMDNEFVKYIQEGKNVILLEGRLPSILFSHIEKMKNK